jgi:hypothetical protein
MKESRYRSFALWARRAVRGAVAPFLILVTPFAVFLQHQDYGFLQPDVLFVLLLMAAAALLTGAAALSPVLEAASLAGLLTFSVDLQFDPPKGSIGAALIFLGLTSVFWVLHEHAARIITLTMAAVLASSVLVRQSSPSAMEGPAPLSSSDRTAGDDQLPLILHLIVDEHIGIEGMPAALTPAAFERDERSFFDRHGFLLFGSAYSEYLNSRESISHLINLKSGNYVPSLLATGTRSKYTVTSNAYFSRLAEMGYAIRVYQSDYLDLCGTQASERLCRTYPATSLSPLAPVSLPVLEKARIVVGMYLKQAHLYVVLQEIYTRTRRQLAPTVALPAWNWERDRTGPLSSMPVLAAIATDLSTARRGDFVMAHLMMPHFPYIYDADCQLRQPEAWLHRWDPEAPLGDNNSPNSRATRYALYFEQASCALKKIDGLLTAIPPSLRRDAIVIIQGDHGSRISLKTPGMDGESRVSASDYADSYSTLFAIRSPHLQAGYDRRLVPITCLMRTLVESGFRSVSALEGCEGTPTVFVSANGRTVATPLPVFGEAPGARLSPAVATAQVVAGRP